MKVKIKYNFVKSSNKVVDSSCRVWKKSTEYRAKFN